MNCTRAQIEAAWLRLSEDQRSHLLSVWNVSQSESIQAARRPLRIERPLIAWGLLTEECIMTELGTAVMAYAFAIEYPFQ